MTKATLFSLLASLLIAGCTPAAPTLPALPAVSIQEAQRQIDAATNAAATSTQAVAETQSAASLGMTATVGYAQANAQVAALALSSSQTAEAATASAAETQTATAVVPITSTYQAASGQATNVKIANLIQDEQTTQARSNLFWDNVIQFINAIMLVVAWTVGIVLFGFAFFRVVYMMQPALPPLLLDMRRALAAPLQESPDPVEGEIMDEPDTRNRLEKWQAFIIDFCAFGERPTSPLLDNTQPFSERRFDLLGVEQPLWETVRGWLLEAHVLIRLNPNRANSGAYWSNQWTLDRLRREIRLFQFPYPVAADPPPLDVSVLDRVHIHQNTPSFVG